ncbi:S-adenosyl-L-methionine-dependent methyltransferase [Mollisia scopiformis]|uniref:S-adenosyl-L-methionine-dependent methyltransferase n=1 Tax=Mollisia scopiformis TaxID=149040 RepID=A0A194XS34_MOLSC|nr:S-adenosyl-L-methionine-dependent methyltransferase [Mollisia scopiformis]KUJ22537.1 S-adenosyl-L-methionine-dependent methyltransferase [Mollisia scopiformis]
MATTTAKDPTFRSYSAEEAKVYATHRLSYPETLYNKVLEHHASTGGQFTLLFDVGCGPGNATRDVALSFDRAIGADPGEAMIGAARELGGKTKSGAEIRYEACPAEGISKIKGLEAESVDLLTSAMAVHWFDMPKFWAEAAKVVKPGGTVALWTCSSAFCHPSTPNADKVMEILLHFERVTLAPYTQPGNLLSMNMYDDLPRPWTVSPPVKDFPESKYIKHDWDRDGKLSDGKDFFGGGEKSTLKEIEAGMGTASMVTRWRAANPELVGTDKDVVKVFIKDLKEALGGQDWVERGSGTTIMLFKKS